MATDVTSSLLPSLWGTIKALSSMRKRETVIQPGTNQAMLCQGSQCLPFILHVSKGVTLKCLQYYSFICIINAQVLQTRFACTVKSENFTRDLDFRICLHTHF